MKVTFLGTGNAIGIPSPFCRCKVCEYARTHKDKNVRTRSSIIINDDLIIDIGPDIFHQCIRNNINLTGLKAALLTHTHSDHFAYPECFGKEISMSDGINVLNIYMSEAANDNAIDAIEKASLNSYITKKGVDSIEFNVLKPNKVNRIGEYNVIPFFSSHYVKGDEFAFNYIVAREGQTILYGTDTGSYNDETLKLLKNYSFDVIIYDCNNGIDGEYSKNHSNFYEFNQLIHQLLKYDAIKSTTRLIGTHIAHNSQMIHIELENMLKQTFHHKFEVAYDGMIIDENVNCN
ncbi:MBL fold metallo-hydrolase [Vallitalea sp.]|jgi:phosphoribosyl 1,2-cyclic phosphate phosphodiesterase|uniref:MBL fold metallo-hydrolase n=1 Tax=Vallitalea sp. TaxID=1882829 RepID=UPI0025EBD7E0|nr:MBL fold metallo-hydrolase [Vallitalea sp.]MCT4686698.1 MBL fold metallo-hydrolase [Vallitalea sp.]